MKRVALALLLIAAIAAVATIVLLPPRPAGAGALSSRTISPTVRGAFHIHSVRSDGTGTVDEIAAAAAGAGLQFIVLTDHGDGTRTPDPPVYRSGVLCIDAAEISTALGHYVALGLTRALPYRLAGHPRDVIEDVRREGGFGAAAHPGSPKTALQWGDWDAPIDGIEWLNADSEWRDELWGSLGRVLLAYPVRPVETLAAMLDRPEPVLSQWNRLAGERRVFGLAAADAHARLGFRQGTDPYQDRVIARVPSYGVSFRTFVNHLFVDAPLTGDASADAEQVLAAIREGRAFSSIDGLATLGGLNVYATSGGALARVGEYLDLRGPAVIHAEIAAPAGTALVVFRNNEVLYESASPALRLDLGEEAGAYRVEARLPASMRAPSVPWVLTNPIYIGLRERHAAAARPPQLPPIVDRQGIATASWRAEASPGSESALSPGALADGSPALVWQFALAGGTRADQFAAMRFPVDAALAGFKRLQLRARSDRPLRIWAQLRAPSQGGASRWGRSFYIGPDVTEVQLPFAEFRPLGAVDSPRPPLDRIDSLLLVVDTVNTLPGTRGAIQIPDLWLAR